MMLSPTLIGLLDYLLSTFLYSWDWVIRISLKSKVEGVEGLGLCSVVKRGWLVNFFSSKLLN